MKIKKTGNNGFSVVEVMVALFILSVGILACAGLFGTGLAALQVGNQRTMAGQFAKNKMTSLVLLNPTLVTGGHDDPVSGMKREWSVTCDNTCAIRTVSVTMTWGAEGQPKTLLLKRFVFY